MKVLITGDRGYIGSVMTTFLSKRGHEVVGWDTEYYFDCDFTAPVNSYPCLRGDIRDITREQLQGLDAIIHLAALSNDPLGDLRREWTFDINQDASVRLAKLAKQAGVRRFLFASSCSLYGTADDRPVDEEGALHPLTPYAISKVCAEQDLGRLADDCFSPTYLRNATAYGVSPRQRVDLVLNNLVGWAVTTGNIRILSDGTPWRPIVHVEDIAQAFASVLEAPIERVHNEAFNVGWDGENYQVRELAAIVQRVAKSCQVEYAAEAGPDPRNYRVNFAKFAGTFPTFRLRWNALEGARELCEAYREARMTFDVFQGRKFTRLNQLQYLIDGGHLDGALRWKGTGTAGV